MSPHECSVSQRIAVFTFSVEDVLCISSMSNCMHIDAGMRQGEMILYSICLHAELHVGGQHSNKLFLYARVGGGFIKISYREGPEPFSCPSP